MQNGRWTCQNVANTIHNGRWTCPHVGNPMQNGRWTCQNVANTIQNGRWTCPHVVNPMQNGRWTCPNVANTMQNDKFKFQTVGQTLGKWYQPRNPKKNPKPAQKKIPKTISHPIVKVSVLPLDSWCLNHYCGECLTVRNLCRLQIRSLSRWCRTPLNSWGSWGIVWRYSAIQLRMGLERNNFCFSEGAWYFTLSSSHAISSYLVGNVKRVLIFDPIWDDNLNDSTHMFSVRLNHQSPRQRLVLWCHLWRRGWWWGSLRSREILGWAATWGIVPTWTLGNLRLSGSLGHW